MTQDPSIAHFILTSILAGVLGVVAMELTMWVICRTGWAKGNMIVAVGSLFTGRREHAFRNGSAAHLAMAIIVALIYRWIMLQVGFAAWPRSVIAGVGFGFFQGMIVSLALVWVVAEQHPLPEFREAGFAVAMTHLAGHLAYGLLVGVVIGLTPG